MKKSLILPFVLLSLNCFSQDTIKLPTAVARQIVKDLVDYESVKVQLQLSKKQLQLTEKACQAKDTIILNYRYKVENCESKILIEREKIELYKQEADRLKKDYRKLKFKTTLTQIGSGIVIGTLTYFLIVK